MPTQNLFQRKGAITTYHREKYTTLCPCVTPEGFRDPIWHKNNPTAPVCNERGYLSDPIEFQIRAFVQPIYGSRRLSAINQNLLQTFGEIEIDDHLAIVPTEWNGVPLTFDNWSDAGDEWIGYNDKRFIVISWIEIPDPHNSQNIHHFELSLRRINTDVVGQPTQDI